jgi:poly-gamma-glutamate synthesis protein (capsule biosynthesis protein)
MLNAGFNVFALANNHINDSGQKGLMRTLKLIKPHPTMGAYLNTSEREQQYPIILHVDGLKIALFNTTYGTNQIPPVAPNIINYIETEQIEMDIAKSLKDSTIDLRIMYIHWGSEYELKHNSYQKGLAQWLADLGFDVIIGSHPHVVQDQDTITAADGRQVPVVYSLGNLVSNQRWENSNGGVMVMLDVNRETKQLQTIQFVPYYVHKGSLVGEGDPRHQNCANYYCIPTFDYINGRLPFILDETAVSELNVFHQNTIKRLKLE